MACPPLHVLMAEPTFPGKLAALAVWLGQRGNRCQFYCQRPAAGADDPSVHAPGLHLTRYNVGGAALEPVVEWTRHLERGYCHAYAVYESLLARRNARFDLIIGRSGGLGSTLFLPALFPNTPIVQRLDPFLDPAEGDLAGEDGPELGVAYRMWRRSANTMSVLEIENGALPWATSAWVRDTFPREYRRSISLLPEGVDTRRFAPRTHRPATIAGRSLEPNHRLVTFVARSADRLRGVDHFVTLAERLIAARDDVICAVVGETSVTRMLDVKEHGGDTLTRLLATSSLGQSPRFWRTGYLPRAEVASFFARSDLHVELSRLHEATRTLGEAMSSGCAVLAWDNPPNREWIEPGQTGILVPYGDSHAFADAALSLIGDPPQRAHLGQRAAAWVRSSRDKQACFQKLTHWFEEIRSSPT